NRPADGRVDWAEYGAGMADKDSAARPQLGRHRAADGWSGECGAEVQVQLRGGSLRVVGPGRTTIGEGLSPPPYHTVTDVLEQMLNGAPAADGRVLEGNAGELRHAFWTIGEQKGRPQREFYGLVIRRGTALQVTCIYNDADDQPWALRTWRSVRFRPVS